MKTSVLVLKLSQPAQIRPLADVECHVGLPHHRPVSSDGQVPLFQVIGMLSSSSFRVLTLEQIYIAAANS